MPKQKVVPLKHCPYCDKDIGARGFPMHLRWCKIKHQDDPVEKPQAIMGVPIEEFDKFKARYKVKLARMSPVGQERYIYKALGIPWDKRKYEEGLCQNQ